MTHLAEPAAPRFLAPLPHQPAETAPTTVVPSINSRWHETNPDPDAVGAILTITAITTHGDRPAVKFTTSYPGSSATGGGSADAGWFLATHGPVTAESEVSA